MADANEFYLYLTNIRVGISDYIGTNSVNSRGTQSSEQMIELVKLNLLEACVDHMNKYDPTTTIHMFTADEMRDFMALINDILDTNHNVDFDQYYV